MQIDHSQTTPPETAITTNAPLDIPPSAPDHTVESAPAPAEVIAPPPTEEVAVAPVQADTIPPVQEEIPESVKAQPESPAPPSDLPPTLHTRLSHDRDEEDERPSKRVRLDSDAPSGNGSIEPPNTSVLDPPTATLDHPAPAETIEAPPTLTTDAPLGNGITEAAIAEPVERPLEPEPVEISIVAPTDGDIDVAMGNGIDEAAAEAPVADAAVAPAGNGIAETVEAPASDVPTGNGITIDTSRTDVPVGGPVSAVAETPATPGPDAAPSFDATPMSNEQRKYLIEQVRKTKKVKNSAAFLKPVDIKALNIPTYPDYVPHPMDLTTIEEKLKGDQYPTVDDCISDVYLMVDNSRAFNGPTHPVTLAGENLRNYFLKTLAHLPRKGVKAVEEKKPKKPTPEKRTSLPRRETRPMPAPPTPASATVAGSPSQPFALGPEGVPLIRRDSAAADGRPKREIHRPPPKDLPYTNPRPRSKKAQQELKFCEYVLKTLYDKNNYSFVYPFYKPVDPVALNIPNYHNIIKKPMDLETIEKNFKQGQYTSAKEFKEHVELMLKNCFKFNPESDFVHQCGKQTEQLFKDTWAQKEEWIREHVSTSEPRSEEEDEEEEEEEEEDDGEGGQASRLDALQKQIAALHQEMTSLVSSAKGRTSPGAKDKKKAKTAKTGGSKKVKRSDSAAAAPAATKASKPKKEKKIPKLTQDQKREVSEGIGLLDDVSMRKAVQIIRNGVPHLRVCYRPIYFVISFVVAA